MARRLTRFRRDVAGNAVRVLVAVCLVAASVVVAVQATTSRADNPPAGTVMAWGDNSAGRLGDGNPTVQVQGLTDITAIDTMVDDWYGTVSVLALGSGGIVYAWGENSYGQLGLGNTVDQRTPVQVPGLSDVTAITSCGFAAFALKTDGTVYAWGYNWSGVQPSPVQIQSLSSVAAIECTGSQAFALKTDGTVYGWGKNRSGVLGLGNTTDQPSPVQIQSLSSVAAIECTGSQAFALKTDGTVFAWGENSDGELGLGNTTDQLAPVQVLGLVDIAAVTLHRSPNLAIFALKSDGTVFAWGRASGGVLGLGSTTYQPTPIQMPGLSGVTAVTTGGSTWYLPVVFALRSDGTVVAWGQGNVGIGNTTDQATPVEVPDLAGVTAISTKGRTSYALRTDGVVLGWEDNYYRQLGNPGAYYLATPVQIPNLSDVTAIAGGFNSAYALRNDGTVHAWGHNGSGQLGGVRTVPAPIPALNGITSITTRMYGYERAFALKGDGTVYAWGTAIGSEWNVPESSFTPVQVPGLSGITAMSASRNTTFALRDDGSVFAWGWNFDGALGIGQNYITYEATPVPVQIPGLSGITSIATDELGNSVFALKSDGTVFAWGSNRSGELGDGTTDNRTSPIQINGLSNVIAIEYGSGSTLALKGDGTVFAWGAGYLGVGDTSGRLEPTQVPGIADAAAITTGLVPTSVYVLNGDGTVYAWGVNTAGELGIGSTDDQLAPVLIPGLTDVASISVASAQPVSMSGSPPAMPVSSVFALKDDGAVFAWGSNAYGNLGIGNSVDQLTPVPVSGLGSVAMLEAEFGGSAFALSRDGTVHAWGRNDRGQLGIGNTVDQLTPVPVSGLGNVASIEAMGTPIDTSDPSAFSLEVGSLFAVIGTTPNTAPTATIDTATPSSGDGPLTVSFAGSGSDVDGAIVSYSWDFGDGTPPDTSGSSVTHTYWSPPGTYRARLTATDDDGASRRSAAVTITVTAPNVAPWVTIDSVTPTGGDAPLSVAFTAAADDFDGTIASYSWDFGDGTAPDTSGAGVSHTYAAAGTFSATVTVTDDRGATATAPATVTVTNAAEPQVSAAQIVSPQGGVSTDQSGNTVVSMPSDQREPLTWTADLVCPDGAAVVSASLRNGAYSTPMALVGGSVWTGTIPGEELTSGPVWVEVVCPDVTATWTVGLMMLYDPSGVVTDSFTGEAVVGASVRLFKVPSWTPRTAPEDTGANTCETNESKPAGAGWSQAAPVDEGVEADPNSGEISPRVNPTATADDGSYGWDVGTGCWYVVVEADGYETVVSPVVGVPSAVTDLDLVLTSTDDVAPVVAESLAGPAGVDGWYRGPVDVTVAVTDTGAGAWDLAWEATGAWTHPREVVSGDEAAFSVAAEGVTTVSVEGRDRAGNVATRSFDVKVDTTAPEVAVGSPAEGASYVAGTAVTADYDCSDALSGVASCDGSVADGATVDTTTAGPHTVEVTGADKAGNTTTRTVSYQVTPPPPVGDVVSVAFSGGVTYTNSATLLSGDFSVVRANDGKVASVQGTGTIPGVNNGAATVTVSLRRFWTLSLWTGQIRVSDPSAATTVVTPLWLSSLGGSGKQVSATSSWINLAKWPPKGYQLTWAVTDNR